MHIETSRRLVDSSSVGEYITGVTVTGQVCCLHQTQKPGRHLSPAISCQHHQPWRHLGPARSCTEHRAKIHSGNLTLHRADRATDISTGLLFNWNCKSVSVVKQSVWTCVMRILEMGGMLSIHH